MKNYLFSNLKIVIATLLIVCFITIVSIGEYHIFYMKSEYTKIYYGTVTSSYESSGKYSSTCFATVRFDVDGDIQDVNTGHYLYKSGDRFSGSLSWNPIMGISGVAYSWYPKGILVYTMIAALFNIFCILCFVVFLGWFILFCKEAESDRSN